MPNFNIEKAVEKARFTIEKRKLPDVRAQVMMNIDVSGSAQPLFRRGLIQEAFQRVLPIGILFDDNKQIDVFTFSNGSSTVRHIEPNADESNFENYISKNILNGSIPLWGGTDYSYVIRENLNVGGFYKTKKGFFSTKTILEAHSDSNYPAIIYFFTDGENYDPSETMKILQECQDAGTQAYFLFIGIGDANFRFIEKVGDKFDNTGFLNIRDLNKINDDEIYEQLLPEELCTWLSKSITGK